MALIYTNINIPYLANCLLDTNDINLFAHLSHLDSSSPRCWSPLQDTKFANGEFSNCSPWPGTNFYLILVGLSIAHEINPISASTVEIVYADRSENTFNHPNEHPNSLRRIYTVTQTQQGNQRTTHSCLCTHITSTHTHNTHVRPQKRERNKKLITALRELLVLCVCDNDFCTKCDAIACLLRERLTTKQLLNVFNIARPNTLEPFAWIEHNSHWL